LLGVNIIINATVQQCNGRLECTSCAASALIASLVPITMQVISTQDVPQDNSIHDDYLSIITEDRVEK